MAVLGDGFSQWGSDAIAAAKKYGVDPKWFVALIQQESGWNAAATNTNSNGTMDYGIAQLNTRYFPDAMSWSVPQQLDAAAKHLSERYDGDWKTAVAKYNGTGSAAATHANRVEQIYNQIPDELVSTQGQSTTPSLSWNSMFGLPDLPDLGNPGSIVADVARTIFPGFDQAINSAENILGGDNPIIGTVKGIAETQSPGQKAVTDATIKTAEGTSEAFVNKMKEWAAPVAVVVIGAVVITVALASSMAGGKAPVINLGKAR